MSDFSTTTVNGDPWQSTSMSDGPVTTTGSESNRTTALETSTEVVNIESPIAAWLESSKWSREDLRLLTDIIGAIGTLGFLYLALNGVSA
ncbi:hypothetical protein [Halorubrum lipolyticum]|uniref:Uncharacterized protein n=1 Tax=Halorubrum lipolyticum DSM 21995 TaxID=1227482 RepID=M0NKF0_9EURY|nr:hypothetical protein [Halorubrum lipolyticum]EMA57160.1 hypothetical protein C469_15548 [Halorubrum lipolyticum DSM 21995]